MPIRLSPPSTNFIGDIPRLVSYKNFTLEGDSFPIISSYDGPGSVYVPLTTSDFDSLSLTDADYLWLCQDTAGNMSPVLGGVDLNTTGVNHLYEQAVPSWNRVAVGSTNDNENCGWRALAGSGPDPTSLSAAWLGYFYFPSLPGGFRTFFALKGNVPQFVVQMQSTGNLRVNVNTVLTTGDYNYVDGNVHPIVLAYDRAAETAICFTDKEKIIATWDAGIGDSNKGIGGVTGNNTGIFRCLWLAAYSGSKAEQDWRGYLQKLRWQLSY